MYVINEGIEHFKGPQCFEDKQDLEKLYYYGLGKIRFYRWTDLREKIYQDYGQTTVAKFELNPGIDEINEETFEQYLMEIHEKIRRDYQKYKGMFVEFSGPQCNEDRYYRKEKICYDVKYRNVKSKHDTTPPEPPPNIQINREKQVDLKETYPNCAFSFRRCHECDQIRVLGQRAAEKYPLGFYDYGSEVKRLRFKCNNLFKLNCETDTDIKHLSFKNIHQDQLYLIYTVLGQGSYCGFLVQVKEINNHNNIKVECKKYFGSKRTPFSNLPAFQYNWLNETTRGIFKFGGLSKTGRFAKADEIENEFFMSAINIDPREAKNCQPFHDLNRLNKDQEYIQLDVDDIDQKLEFRSLIAVKNIHSILENIAVLHCIKCNRECPGFEDMDNVTILENGQWIPLTLNRDSNLYNAIKFSEVIKSTDFLLSKKFSNSNVYKKTGQKHVSSICKLCEPYYQVNENNEVIPIDATQDFQDSPDSQESQNSDTFLESQDQVEGPKLALNQINKWGPENFVSLNLWNEHEFACFMKSLTRAEIMVISPLLVNICIIRCRANQIPFSKHGSIAFPLKTPMQTRDLPWINFRNLPFIIIYATSSNEKYRHEAKINLKKIIIAKGWLEAKLKYQGHTRSRNRFIGEGEGCSMFTPENMKKLQEQLYNNGNEPDDEYVIPRDLRQHELSEEEEKMSEPLNKDQVKIWLTCGYQFAQAVLLGLYAGDNESAQTVYFETFWNDLYTFSSELLNKKLNTAKMNNDNDAVKTYEEWISAGTFVTSHTLTEYAEHMKYLNSIDSIEEYDTKFSIFEEFLLLRQNFSNELGHNQMSMGGTVESAGEHPDEIVEKSLKDTALDRRIVEPDRDHPAIEWENGYFQRAFINVFLTGDADLDQMRPVSLKLPKDKHRENWIKNMALQKGVQDKPEFLFTLYNVLKREDARKAAFCVLRDVDITSVNIPTKEDLEKDLNNKTSRLIMQYSAQIRDSKGFWKSQQQNEIGTKRDLEYLDPVSRPDVTCATLASLFRTFAPPYASASYIHRLFTDDENTLKDARKRREFALIHPTEIEWIVSFLAEIDVKYLCKERYLLDWYVTRSEYGNGGNTHWHSVLYSKELGKLTSKLRCEMEDLFEQLKAKKRLVSDEPFTDEEIEDITERITDKFKDTQEAVISYFRGNYVNWNPCYTHDNQLTDDNYGTPDVSTISLTSIIDNALITSDFGTLDKLYSDILMTSCRHIAHSGKDGKPSKKDYCYQETRKEDKEASTAETKVYKVKISCKRRKPQPMRQEAAIYRDPHDKKFIQLSFRSNDGLFNGTDPFLMLNTLGNADTKALVPSIFAKCPKVLSSSDKEDLELLFYLLDSDDPIEYVIKYLSKGVFPLKPDKSIMKLVLERMEYEDTFTKRHVLSMYSQEAVQHCVCLYNAQHVNIQLPQILRNTKCTSLNCLGRKTILKDSKNDSDANDKLYNATVIQKFDKRKDISEKSRKHLSRDGSDVTILNGNLSLRTFYDKYMSTLEKDEKVSIKKRQRISTDGILHTQRMVPHTTLREANQASKLYPEWCKKMCLWSSKYDNITSEVKSTIPNDEVEQKQYWIEEFNKRFPEGKGLEPSFKRHYMHYRQPELFETDSDIEDEELITTVEEPRTKSDEATEKTPSNAKKIDDQFYQDPSDKLYALPNDVDNTIYPTIDDENRKIMEQMSLNFIQKYTVEEDCRQWVGTDINLDSRGLKNKIEATYRKMAETKGQATKEIPINPQLTTKQKLVKDIILEFVTKKKNDEPVKPLRLFVIGIPGAGKTFAFHVAATEMISVLGDEWRDYVRLACPTGSVAYHMSFGAQTIHSTFFIQVGKVGESIGQQIEKLKKLVEKNPKETFLIIFDECSMVGRALFGAVCARLREANIDLDNIGFIFFGDPAQCEPIADKSLWSTEESLGRMSTDGLNDFRCIMEMEPLNKIPFYNERKKLHCKKKLSTSDMEYKKKYDQEFGKFVYDGKYKAVYLDTVKRTDGSVESAEFVKLNTKVRYGKYEHDDLIKLKKMTATEESIKSPEWKDATLLTAYHYFSEENPNRTNVDSSNAKNLVEESKRVNEPIMEFQAVHTPVSKVSDLQKVSAQDFHSLSNKLYLVRGAPLMLTSNINAQIGLFNGAIGKFIGPIYLEKKYSISSLDVLKDAVIDPSNFKTTEQVKIQIGNSSVTLPVGTALTEINEEDFDKNVLDDLNELPFTSATFVLPKRPPFLPDYIVLDIDGYSECGGPPFFPGIERMKNFVCIKPFERAKGKQKGKKHVPDTREQFPVELAYVMTAFKGIGATHPHTIANLTGMFASPGLFLVSNTRVKNPSHLFIPNNAWPTAGELAKQREKNSVLESENFERMVRAKSAQELRKSRYYHELAHIPPDIAKEIVNTVADVVHKLWLEKGNEAKHDENIQCEIKLKVLKECPSINGVEYEKIISFMKKTDEKLLLRKVPRYDKCSAQNVSSSKSLKQPAKTNVPVKPSVKGTKKDDGPKSMGTNNKKASTTKLKVDRHHVNNIGEDVSNNQIIQVSSSSLDPLKMLNLGNTCYINAALQLLLSLDLPLINSPDASTPRVAVAEEFIKLAQLPPGSECAPQKFIDEFRVTTSNLLTDGQQDDTTIPLLSLMENPCIFDETIFNVNTTSTVTCSICEEKSGTVQHNSHLILTVPDHADHIQNLVYNSSKSDKLTAPNQYNCEHCNAKRDADKLDALSPPFPDVLIVYLTRFRNGGTEKNINKVDLGNYTLCLAADRQSNDFENYELHAAICHISGYTIKSGHYISIVKKSTLWYHCSDDMIRPAILNEDVKQDEIVVLAYKKSNTNDLSGILALDDIPGPSCTVNSSKIVSPKCDVIMDNPDIITWQSFYDHGGQIKDKDAVLDLLSIPDWQSFHAKYYKTIEKMKSLQIKTVDNNLNQKVSVLMHDITKLDIHCVINAANEKLVKGGGVDNAIHKAAGAELQKECQTKYGFCRTGSAVMTSGFKLDATFVIHAVGPDLRADSSLANKEKLRECYMNTLDIIFNSGCIRTLAFPCISAGIFKYPNEEAAHVALSVVRDWLEKNNSCVDRIIFCTFEKKDFEIYKKLMANIYFPNA